jgi:hypothetical protein
LSLEAKEKNTCVDVNVIEKNRVAKLVFYLDYI